MGVAAGGIREPDRTSIIDSLHDRLTDRERRTVAAKAGRIPWAFLFTFAGPLGIEDLPIPPLWRSGRLSVVRFQPQTPGSTDTDLEVRLNGSALTPLGAGGTTIVLPGGVGDETSVQFGHDDHLFLRLGGQAADQFQIGITTAGAGAEGLVILAEFT